MLMGVLCELGQRASSFLYRCLGSYKGNRSQTHDHDEKMKRLRQSKLIFGKKGDTGQDEETETKRKREGDEDETGRAGGNLLPVGNTDSPIPGSQLRAYMAPVDDVGAWGESLDHLLKCKTGQLVFEDFLRTEYSEENLLFWLACEDYRKMTSKTKMTVAAKRIYAEFVQVDAPRQINIDCVTREEISENISQPEPNCFDRAQRQIYGLMENDCYPRFLKSEIYQALLEQEESHESNVRKK